MLFDPKWKEETEVDEVGQVLLQAADYMEEHGWCVGRGKNAIGEVCVFGALCNVLGLLDQVQGTNSRIGSSTDRLGRYLGHNPTIWNDTVCKSKEQAVAALRAAAYHK